MSVSARECVTACKSRCMLRGRAYIGSVTTQCVEPLHTLPAGETQSLHFKDSTTLSCYSVKSESQLHSNKTSRTGSRRRGGFWELNNARTEDKSTVVWTPNATKKRLWHGSRISHCSGPVWPPSGKWFLQQATIFTETPAVCWVLGSHWQATKVRDWIVQICWVLSS